jgi:hypothetical protein
MEVEKYTRAELEEMEYWQLYNLALWLGCPMKSVMKPDLVAAVLLSQSQLPIP